MTRQHQKTLKMVELLIKTVKELDVVRRRVGKPTSHLIFHHCLQEIYMHARNCYDFVNPDNTEAVLKQLLATPLGVLLLQDEYAGIEKRAAELRRLQREEERKVNGSLSDGLTGQ